MNAFFQFSLEMVSNQKAYRGLSMSDTYKVAENNLDLLICLINITFISFISFLLIYIFHFKLKKPLIARHAITLFLMILVGVGWPISLYYTFISNITPAVLLLGCFTLLLMHSYLFYVYRVNAFSPGLPIKNAHEWYTRLALMATFINLLLLVAMGVAHASLMIHALRIELLVDELLNNA